MNERTYTADEFYAMHAEYDAEYTQLHETINALKTVLRNIHTTAAKAGNEQATALAWIEGEAARVLRETLEPLA